jgi:hypothetical protein
MNKKICKKHPKYKGIHRPRVDCKKCWEIYDERTSKTSGSCQKRFEYEKR